VRADVWAVIGEMVEQYKVDGVVSEIVRFCSYNTWDKFDLKKQMDARGIPILDIDLEYGHPAGAQVKIRAEAFMEMLESRAREPGRVWHAMSLCRDGNRVGPDDRVWL
jgi:hypothetical protein